MLIRQELDFFAWEGLDGRAGARGAMGRHAPRAGRGGVEGGGTHPLYIYIYRYGLLLQNLLYLVELVVDTSIHVWRRISE